MTLPSVVLLHGFLGAPQSFDAVVERMRPRRSLALALVGHGADAEHVATFEEETARIAACITAQFPGERVHLCGYSLGGRVALTLAAAQPSWLARLTLIGAQPGLEGDAERTARARSDEDWAEHLERDGVATFLEKWEAQPLFATQRTLPREVLDRQRRERLGHDPRELARALRILGLAQMPNLWPQLGRIAQPVDLVVGARDTKFVEIARRMLAALPRGALHAIDDVGHNVVLEAPTALARVLAGEPPS